MNKKKIRIIGWVLSGLLASLLLFSAFGKLSGQMTGMMTSWGFSEGEIMLIAVGEITSLILFLIPRTSSLGTLLLSAYMGGAIATHMQAAPPNDSILMTSIVLMTVWVAAGLRAPETFNSFKG